MGTKTALQAACTALAAGKREQALGKLLVAWRALRHPRIAEVIELVSAELAAKLPAIKGKTVTARMAAWHAIEKARDAATLGQLLATPWPGTWQPALPMLQPLLEWPDDPRMAMAFARIVDETPYATWTSDKFYRPLFAKLDKIADLRTLPLMRAQLAKDKPYYYARDMRPLEERSVAVLEKQYPDGEPPALDAETARLVAQLEAPYAEALARAQQKASGEREHLAAIFADPDDVAARAVYADWLGERGDPRGEFITLQLARASGTPSDAAVARERKLLEEHGVKWAGTMANWFEDDRLEFEGGFFSGGVLRSRYRFSDDFTVAGMVADPGWAFVRTLETSDEDLLRELVDRPELRRLRTLRGLDREQAEALASGPERTLEAIAWRQWPEGIDIHDKSALWHCRSLPALTQLAFDIDDANRLSAWLETAPVFERLERVVLLGSSVIAACIASLAKRGGKLREIELGWESRDHTAGWRVVLQRDAAPGPFTRLVARPRGGPHDVTMLVGKFAEIPPETLRELDVATTKKVVLKKADREELARAVKKLGALERVSVPWESLTPPKAVRAPRGPRLDIRLEGTPLLDVKYFDKVWKLFVEELGQVYDSFEVGYGSTWRPLGDEPFERAKKWAANQRIYRLELIRDGQPGKLVLARGKRHATESTLANVMLGERTFEDFIEWFVKLFDVAAFEHGQVSLDGVERDNDAFDLAGFSDYRTMGGWLVGFGSQYGELLPLAKVKRLASRPGLDGMFARATKYGLVVGAAATPQEATPQRLRALSAALVEVMTSRLPDFLGYDLTARSLAVLSPVARELGLTHDPEHSTATEIWLAKGERRLVVDLQWLFDPDRDVRIQLREALGNGWRAHDLAMGSAKTPAQLEKLLAVAAKQAPLVAPKFFDPRAGAKKKKKKR